MIDQTLGLTGANKRSLSVLRIEVNERLEKAQAKHFSLADDIKRRLAEARGRLSYKEVAERLEAAGFRLPRQAKPLTDVSVRAYELPVGADGGTDKVPADYVLAFAGALGIDPADLLPGVAKVGPKVPGPWAAPLILGAEQALAKLEAGPFRLHLDESGWGRIYQHAIQERWPIQEIQALDEW